MKTEEKNKVDDVKWNGWGFTDSMFVVQNNEVYFKGNRYSVGNGQEEPLEYFKEWAAEVLNVDLSDPGITEGDDLPESYPESNVPNDFLNELQKNDIQFSTSGENRLRKSHGQTLYEIFTLRLRKLPARIPDIVTWPKSHNQVEMIVKLAVKFNMVIIPFGGGTSVSGASACPSEELRPIIAVDTSKMNRLLWINKENLTACFEAGIVGRELEQILQSKGFICGHEPDSYEFSSLGGWVATRASGMKKNVYGNIEDILIGFRMVTPSGTLQKCCDIPRVSCGPDFTHIVLGSEGTLGIITEITLKIRPKPSFRKYSSFVFKNFESGVKCMREIARQRCQPASVRLMDNEQFKFGQALRQRTGLLGALKDNLKKFYLFVIKNFEIENICVMTLLFEGYSYEELESNFKKISAIAESYEGLCAGEKNGELGYQLTFIIAYIRDLALTYKVVAESFETSVPWDKTLPLCNSVKNCLREACQKMQISHYFVSCRVTQTYDTGCCVYFYLGFNWGNFENPVAVFEHLETLARTEILKCGGSISHHHGVGKIRSKFYQSQVSPLGVQLYTVIKKFLDPHNIFGVGNLLCHL
ncbi:alkyldihydroxyacetonephosphate synthase [Planococcus citri]|uniref:alkyldihydroxyacetonephosphate synthase n=1 Tax=Planococcus citri TaxID=170843 RepID=UPI0031F7B49F